MPLCCGCGHPRPEKQIARITTGAYDAPMPTKNPRLTMTLTPTTAAQHRRLSELTGSSQASLISELLEGRSSFSKLIHVLEAAHLAKGQMIEDSRRIWRRRRPRLRAS